jgi:DNA-binding MarR family transcriptional regulator
MNHITELLDKEFLVLQQISEKAQLSQRTIAQKTGLSLGLVNLIIKKLAKTGYIKIKMLNGKKIEYILTPKGFSEKIKKTYNYVLKTINYFSNTIEKIKQIILQEHKNGKKEFYIFADDEIYKIIEFCFKDLSITDVEYKRISKIPKATKSTAVYLVATENNIFNNTKNIINLLQYF